jgi:hypothetical protein
MDARSNPILQIRLHIYAHLLMTDKDWDAYIRSYYYSPYEISEGSSSIMNEGSIVGKAYPNPFNDFLTVKLNSPSAKVEIIDS